MARKQIELYNFDKYQPRMVSPQIDRIEGNADEMVLSADGYEASASDGLPGSLTINANGGLWMDTGPGVTCDVSSRVVTTTDTSVVGDTTFLSFKKSAFRAADIQAIVQAGNTHIMQKLMLIHDNTNVELTTGDSVAVPSSHGMPVVYSAEITDQDVTLKIAGVPANTVVKCMIRYILT